ncbi:hypothetical protein [Kaarinaea lacus]
MKYTFLKGSIFASIILFMFACSHVPEKGESSTAATGDQAGYEKLNNKVMVDYKKLDSEGGAWRDTGEILEKSQEAAKKNDFATAVKLVKEASDQTQQAMQQFEGQKNVRPWLF